MRDTQKLFLNCVIVHQVDLVDCESKMSFVYVHMFL